MQESKIESVQGSGTFNPEPGVELYKYEYRMEDGTTLTAFHKTQAPVAGVGEAVVYEVTKTGTRGKSGKVRKPGEFQPSGGGGWKAGNAEKMEFERERQGRIGRQWAVNAAIEFMTSTSSDPGKITLRDVCANARHFDLMAQDFDAYLDKSKGEEVKPSDDFPF